MAIWIVCGVLYLVRQNQIIMSIINWPSKSGKMYPYNILQKGQSMPDEAGAYIFVKTSGTSIAPTYNAIYIGEGESIRARTSDEEHLSSAESKGYDQIHVHTNQKSKEQRMEEEADLLAKHTEALHTNGGCNKTADG